MSGISQASGILAARVGLWNAIQAATAHRKKIDRYYAVPLQVTAREWVGLGGFSADPELTNIGGRRQFMETITLDVSIGSWAPGRGHAAEVKAFENAFEIVSEIQTYITTGDNITLGGAVLWAMPGSLESVGIENEDGRGFDVEIACSWVCGHRVLPS